MYAQFFGLEREPFSIAPDPGYLFMSERHRDALAHLLYGLGGGGGFVLLSGEIGTGKTTICRYFLDQVPQACNVAYIFNPKLTVLELLSTVCDEFGITVQPRSAGGATVKDYIDPLNDFLLASHAAGQSSVLIIDEAQNLSADVLEQLRLLTNLETHDRKLLQIVLIGQPELRAMLARPELEQLAQRVIARFHLESLSQAETTQYIAHRLGVAGLKGDSPFEPQALVRIYTLSRGVPRRINLLCDRALLGAYAQGKARVDRAIVDSAAAEVFEGALGMPAGRRLGKLAWAAAGVAIGLALLAAVSLWMGEDAGKTVVAAPPAVVAATASTALPAASAAAPQPLRDPAAAWRHLGALWTPAVTSSDPCGTAAQASVQCFSRTGTLAELRTLDRPVVLALEDVDGQPVYGVLLALGDAGATLDMGGVTRSVSLAGLTATWHGSYATFWQVPPGYSDKLVEGDSGPAVDWLGATLAALAKSPPPAPGGTFGPALRARVLAFQRSHGLSPDGRAGPMTLMQLNRASGVQEPRLAAAGD